MKKTLTFLVLTMFLFSLGTVFAIPENTGPQDGTGINHDAVIAAGGQNGTGAQGAIGSQDGTGMGNGSGNVDREQVGNKSTGSNLMTRNQNFFPNANMSLGQCKAGFAKEQNACMKEFKAKQKECKSNARNSTNKKAELKLCSSNYKNETKQCKATYKLGKTECGNLTQKNSII
jgi:hypothetical protein